MSDIQTSKILSIAKDLESITNEELAVKVLEIELTADSSRQVGLLRRLVRSLDQYINKERSIIYVGLAGHYSSGKSSTLNSLLDLGTTQQKRDTGLNPTDKSITLITHPKNSNTLVLMSREGGNVPIRSVFIEHSFLDQIVISDTPGSGDPDIVNEMIQDFLPICDFIFYFISATNPIDQADLPLLIQKSKKLPFIPVKYIITRSDEFRIDKNRDISDSNFDQPKKDLFTGKLIARLKEIFPSDNLSPNDFIFIDNIANYNISTLRDHLSTTIENLDVDQLVKIHGYKIDYYQNSLDQIRSYFLKVIDEKIKQSKGYEKTASENISRFDKSAEINNEKLKIFWSSSDSKFKEGYNEEITKTNSILDDTFTIKLEYNSELQKKKKAIIERVDSLANGYYGNVVTNTNDLTRQRIREIKNSIIDNINTGELLMGNISHLFPTSVSISFNLEEILVDFTKLELYINYYLEKAIDILKNTKLLIKGKIRRFNSLIDEEQTIAVLNQLYKSGEKSINDNFDQYFERIQMYRSTVLTRNTKETIERLRIGTQLDELDDEFSEEFMLEMKQKAINSIYKTKDLSTNELRNKANSIRKNLIDLKIKIDKIGMNENEKISELAKKSVSIASLIEGITNSKNTSINKVYQEQLKTSLNNHKKEFDIYTKSLVEKSKKRKRSIWKWTILSAIGAFIIYSGLNFFSLIPASTLDLGIIASLIANAIGALVGFVIGYFKNDIKKIKTKSKEEFIEERKVSLLQDFNENFWDEISNIGDNNENLTNPSFEIKKAYNSRINEIIKEILEKYQTLYDELLSENSGINSEIKEYKVILANYYKTFSAVFSGIDHNSNSIEDITKKIKEVSVKPSFELLEETTTNLISVREKIQKLNS